MVSREDAGRSGLSQEQFAVLSLSGGMDSTSLLLHMLARGFRVMGLSFDYGQKHAIELERLQDNLKYLEREGHHVDWRLVNLRSVGELLHSSLLDGGQAVPEGHYEEESMKSTFVPNRNAMFASVCYAAALSLGERESADVVIGLGVHSGDHAIYPDCRPEFYEQLMKAFRLGNWGGDRVNHYLPYVELDKYGILVDAQRSVEQLGLDFTTIFRNTITSYAPDRDGRSKGLTGSDIERILAFDRLGIPDPLPYAEPWEMIVGHARELEAAYRTRSRS